MELTNFQPLYHDESDMNNDTCSWTSGYANQSSIQIVEPIFPNPLTPIYATQRIDLKIDSYEMNHFQPNKFDNGLDWMENALPQSNLMMVHAFPPYAAEDGIKMDLDNPNQDELSKTSAKSPYQQQSDQPKKKRKKRKSRSLNAKAVGDMEEWYVEHEDEPYPNRQDKLNFSLRGKITIAQVNCWFANRRNRCNNTRPKRNLVLLQQNLASFADEVEEKTLTRLRAGEVSHQLFSIIDKYLEK